jgi:hypothetical protein
MEVLSVNKNTQNAPKDANKSSKSQAHIEQRHRLLDEFIMFELEHSYYDDKKRDRYLEEMKLFAPQPFVEQHILVRLLIAHIAQREFEGLIRTKPMPDGTVKIYDASAYVLHCCGTVEHWKKCPEKDCIMDNLMPTCPYFKDLVNQAYIDTIIIGADNDQKTKIQKKENSGNA